MDLTTHILRVAPWNWQDQYDFSGATVPQRVRDLLEALEHIEKDYPTNRVLDGPINSAKVD